MIACGVVVKMVSMEICGVPGVSVKLAGLSEQVGGYIAAPPEIEQVKFTVPVNAPIGLNEN